jgi:hypothetical protein
MKRIECHGSSGDQNNGDEGHGSGDELEWANEKC